MTDKIIELRNVTKTYQEGDSRHLILNSASAVIYEGERVAVLGKSGSGKSTLLNLISGIDRPDSGTIQVLRKDFRDINEREQTLLRRRHIGFVFQFFNLIPTLTVWENVRLPVEINSIRKSDADSRVQSLLGEVGLADRAGAYPDQLSGGEQQRVAIARALSHDPAIILADEPTGNLDEDTGREILHILSNFTMASGKTLVLVTHSKEAAGLANRRLYLHDCKLDESQSVKL